MKKGKIIGLLLTGVMVVLFSGCAMFQKTDEAAIEEPNVDIKTEDTKAAVLTDAKAVEAVAKVKGLGDKNKPVVVIKTSKGDITVELNREKAPLTVANFLQYVKSGQYKNTIFHRVINNFMIQGGGFTTEFKQKKTIAPIKNEATNGLKNERGTIAMARTGDPHSGKAQFFINVINNKFLNNKDKSRRGYGYCVFGKVIKGMDVVDKIKSVQTGNHLGYRNVPKENVVIYDIESR